MQLAMRLTNYPGAPEIQSYDGICIDVIWDPLILSIVDDRYAISHGMTFAYFDTPNEALDYIAIALLSENRVEECG